MHETTRDALPSSLGAEQPHDRPLSAWGHRVAQLDHLVRETRGHARGPDTGRMRRVVARFTTADVARGGRSPRARFPGATRACPAPGLHPLALSAAEPPAAPPVEASG